MFPALALLLILIPLQSYIAHRISSLTELTSYLTASRIHLMSETLTALKLIKLHAWERFFLSNARKVREKEVRRVRSILLLKALGHSIAWSVGVVSAVTCFAVLVFVTRRGVPMTASTVFTVLALLNALRHPLTTLPIAIRTTLGAKSSLERLDAFLRQPDIEELSDSTQSGGINLGPLLLPPSQPSQQPGQPGPLRVVLMGVTIGYDGASTPALQNLSMALQQGQLLAIVGAVGAGKSSILAAIMVTPFFPTPLPLDFFVEFHPARSPLLPPHQGQLHLDHGTRHVHGRIAYVPHDPFIVNASLRDNILFGKPYDTARYSEILRVCNLKRDLLQLSHGDATELGERGVNLSMGQRQRVALARACYCDAEIVLLDDPLSVMDAHVGKHIFTECIKGYLRNKAIIFVTNQLHFLEHCDHILVMENGICTEQGSYSTLLANDVNLASLIGDSIEIEDPSLIDEMMNEVRLEPGPSGVHRNSTSAPNSARPSATLEEVRSEGSIHLTVPGNPAKRPASASRRPSSTGVVTMPITFREPDPPSRPSFHQPSPSESMVQHDVATINRIIEQNSHTIQSMNITPQTIAQYVERTQLTILSGAGIPGTGGGGETTRVVNNTDVNAMQKAIEKNQLTIHSLADVEVGPGAAILDPETGLVVVRKQRRRKKATEFVLWWGYIKRKTGAMLGILMLVGFFLVWGVRVFS
ncbi:P-loop containing nucleoside triphosphate hydrolase protein, partial [Jimgerdemannia flammicorona]